MSIAEEELMEKFALLVRCSLPRNINNKETGLNYPRSRRRTLPKTSVLLNTAII